MNQELKAKWVAALRSGQYLQATGVLKNSAGQMCCLGVLCDVQGLNWDENIYFKIESSHDDPLKTSHLPEPLSAGISMDIMGALANKNDGGASFEEIATYIEKNL